MNEKSVKEPSIMYETKFQVIGRVFLLWEGYSSNGKGGAKKKK